MSRLARQSLLHALYESQLHPVGPFPSRQEAVSNFMRERFFEEVPRWSVYKTASPFNRRVTCIEWHPIYPNMVAYGAHSGDIYLWSFEDPSRDQIIKGLGYGYGWITDMKFNPEDPSLIYTASVDGRFCLQDFSGRKSDVLLDTMNLQFWWCCVDISREHNVIFVGDNAGSGVCLDSHGQKVAQLNRIHKGKIKFAQFSPRRTWSLVTSSADHKAMLWDIRMLTESSSNKPKALTVMEHKAPVSSAYFDPIHSSRILTTAQNSELRVYEVVRCCEEPISVIKHPHRFYQHMTDIKATWHPLYENTCIVGRYPEKGDEDQTRTVDVLDLESGERVASFYSPHLSKIIQVNSLSKQGDMLASGMGYTALIWKFSATAESVKDASASRSGKNLLPTNDGVTTRGKKRRLQDASCAKLKESENTRKKRKLQDSSQDLKKKISVQATRSKRNPRKP